MEGIITLSIPQQFFTKDFLDFEVKKELGVKGDELIRHFTGTMKEIHSNNRNSRLFNKKMFFLCKATKNSVVLTGSKI